MTDVTFPAVVLIFPVSSEHLYGNFSAPRLYLGHNWISCFSGANNIACS